MLSARSTRLRSVAHADGQVKARPHLPHALISSINSIGQHFAVILLAT